MTDIYFRTDGNSEIATGHLMRCLAIARACARKGAFVTFLVSDEESLSLLQERFASPQEFAACCLHTDYRDPEQEIPVLLSFPASCMETAVPASSGRSALPWLFLDSYYATPAYFQALRGNFRVAYLDDLRCFDCPVDLLINYDTEEDCACYAGASRRLLGPRYTPLREQFRAVPYEVRPAAEHVLLSTGGTDPYRVTEALLRIIYPEFFPPEPNAAAAGSIPALRSLHYHVLTSRSNSRYEVLTEMAQACPHLHIHTNVTDVAALMASCDLAVSAGGTTLCELCAVGVPSVSCLMAENQRTIVETYEKKRLIPCAGDVRPVPPPETVSRILTFLADMARDFPARAAVSSSMKSFLDGSGAEKIAQALLS